MRTVWKGALSFGLVNVPIRLYPATRARELKFKLLHKKDLSEIRYARICKADGKEVPWEDIVKGYEYEKGDYVVLSEEDFQAANLKKTKTIEILNFVEENEIDSIYYSTPYYLEPEKGAAKAYHLLCEALKHSKKVGIGKIVLRQHEHIGVIKAQGNLLLLNELRYASEVISPNALDIPKGEKPQKRELEIAVQFIDQLTQHFNPKNYADSYTEEIKAVIEDKAKGHRRKIKKEKEPKRSKVHDIMALLKQSLEQQKKAKKPKAA